MTNYHKYLKMKYRKSDCQCKYIFVKNRLLAAIYFFLFLLFSTTNSNFCAHFIKDNAFSETIFEMLYFFIVHFVKSATENATLRKSNMQNLKALLYILKFLWNFPLDFEHKSFLCINYFKYSIAQQWIYSKSKRCIINM